MTRSCTKSNIILFSSDSTVTSYDAPAQGRQRKCLEIQGVEAPAQLGVEAPAANPRRENVARNDPANRQWLAKYCGEVLGWAA